MSIEARDTDITQGVFWRAVGARPVGTTLVTCSGEAGPAGFLALSFAHVSADPPMVLASAGRGTSALPVIQGAGCFAVNLLPAGMEAMARDFGGAAEAGARFATADWSSFATGAPVLSGAACVFDCHLAQSVETEGAIVLIGRVMGVRIAEAGGVTLAYQGGYCDI